MKKVALFVCLLIAAPGVILAASRADNPTSITARATALTRAISDRIRLDEGQYLRLKQLNIRMLSEQEELKSRFAAEQPMLDQRLADAQLYYEMALLDMLRPAQRSLFDQHRASMTAMGTLSK
ncbi:MULTISPECIES: hypothetical protein [Hymenobacter]|uniref:Periplasmic heavy metal sensor n=2 Tax=Hymenobacter TaxID=89966 RepID=A0A7Y7PL15_9BACT|nr:MULTISPECIES: hypothetical protein [Hymenobacter]NVO29748.1 hypothetical protein [Hymenobacter lapidiphilus]NVO84239.1 hypothetical protein [Hymenobacter terrestris]